MINRSSLPPTRQEFSENRAELNRLAKRTKGAENSVLRLDGAHFRTGEAGKWKARLLKVVAKVVPALKDRVDYTLKELEEKTTEQQKAAVRQLGYMAQNSNSPDDPVLKDGRTVVTVSEAINYINEHPTSRITAARDTWVKPLTTEGWRAGNTKRDNNIDPLKIEDNLELEYAIETNPEAVESKLQKAMSAAGKQQQAQYDAVEQTRQKIESGESVDDLKLEAAVKFDQRVNKNWQIEPDESTDLSGLKSGVIQLDGFNGQDRSSEFHTEDVTASGIGHTEGRRQGMEDAVLCTTFKVKTRKGTKTIKLTGVFDGHGGDAAALHAQNNLVKFLKKRFQEGNPKELDDLRIMNALKLAFVDTSNSYRPPEGQKSSGSTANVVLQIDDNLWTANLGDARTVLVAPDGGVQQLSEDAKPDDETYKNGIEKRGGEVWGFSGVPRVSGGAAVARSMGDHYSYGALSARPKVTKFEKPLAGWAGFKLVQGCDGLFDVATSEAVGKVVQKAVDHEDMTNAAIAGHLAKFAYDADSQDNVSVVVTSLG